MNLKLSSNGIYAVIGPNGAGKTTLLKILAMLIKPTEGHIYYNGLEVQDKEREMLRKMFTMVFQNTVLFNSTVYNNIKYGLKVRGLDKKATAKKIQDTSEELNLDGLVEKHVYSLSVGQQQRVALARALILEPKILILDESIANLDPENTSMIERQILKFSKKRTVVVATHNLAQIYRLADRVIFLDSGLIIDQGDKNILKEPNDERIERFVQGNYLLSYG